MGNFADEGYKLIGAAFEVYNENGGGLLEEIYQESLEIELGLREIPFAAKLPVPVFYKGRELQKRYIPDLIVHGAIIVELKAVANLAPEHESQLLNYLRISRSKVGYLINFAHPESLQWKRYIL
jgi:GxxExxY protein